MNDKTIIHHYFTGLAGWLKLEVSPKGVRSISYVKRTSVAEKTLSIMRWWLSGLAVGQIFCR